MANRVSGYVKKLLEMPPVKMAEAREISPGERGVYLVSDPGGRHLYVGMAEGSRASAAALVTSGPRTKP